jgi:hypothetical protein
MQDNWCQKWDNLIGLVKLIVLEPAGQPTAMNIEEVVPAIQKLQERMEARMDVDQARKETW